VVEVRDRLIGTLIRSVIDFIVLHFDSK